MSEVNMFSDEFYAGGGSIPEGDYALEFVVQMFQATNRQTGAKVGKNRLGVMLHLHPIDEEGTRTGPTMTKFYGMGGKADQSFTPNDSGKGLDAVPGGPFQTLMGSTNWNELRKSLVNCDPQLSTLVGNDLSVLDGVWAHMHNIPEPEERKNMKSNTADVEEEEAFAGKGSGLILVCAEIKENGKPWEGSGGIPEGGEEPAPVAKPAVKAGPKPVAKPVAKPVTKPAAKPVAKPAPKPVPADDEEDVATLAVNLISAQLEANPEGLKRLKLRTEVFKAAGKDNQNAVISLAFKDDDSLNAILNPLGYAVDANGNIAQQ